MQRWRAPPLGGQQATATKQKTQKSRDKKAANNQVVSYYKEKRKDARKEGMLKHGATNSFALEAETVKRENKTKQWENAEETRTRPSRAVAAFLREENFRELRDKTERRGEVAASPFFLYFCFPRCVSGEALCTPVG